MAAGFCGLERAGNGAKQSGEGERRIGSVLKSTVFRRRRVTAADFGGRTDGATARGQRAPMPDLRSALPALCLLAIAWPSEAAAQPDTLDTSRIDAQVEAVMASSRIPGVALGIVHEDRVVYLKGYGDGGNGGPVTPQTPFYLASVSKPFTAQAVVQLVEAGKLELDHPVQKYLPEFQLADADAAARITVGHLLSHVSGLSTFSGRQHYFSRDDGPEALAGYVRELKDVRPTAPVGAKFQYSNTNFTVLARLVEVVSGMPFEQYVRDRILLPLGMARTCFSTAEAKGRATGYRYWFGRPVAFSGLPSSRHHLGASGMYSSAEDLSRFLIAQLNGGQVEGRSILTPKGIEEMHRPAVEIRPELHYALGWNRRDTPNGRYVGHGGDWADFHADLIMSPEDRWGVVVLMNVNGTGATPEMRELAGAVLDLSRGRPVLPPRGKGVFARVVGPMLKVLPVLQVILTRISHHPASARPPDLS
jgi:CubicO group peptidase (beta-lactamase class C family)